MKTTLKTKSILAALPVCGLEFTSARAAATVADFLRHETATGMTNVPYDEI